MAKGEVREHSRHYKSGKVGTVRRHSRNYAGANNTNNGQYEPSPLFNAIAKVVFGFLGVALAFTLIKSGVVGAGEMIKNSKVVKDIGQTVNNVTAPKSKVTNDTKSLKGDIVDSVIDEVKDKILENYDVTDIDYVYLLDYEKVNSEDSYTKNIVNKLKKENKKYLFVVYNSGSLNQEDMEAENTNISNLMKSTHKLDKSKGYDVKLITYSGTPYNNNLIHAILYH